MRCDDVRLSLRFKNSQEILAQCGLIAGGQLFVAFDAAMDDQLQRVFGAAARGLNQFERKGGGLVGVVMQNIDEHGDDKGVDIGGGEALGFAVGVRHAEQECAADLSLRFGGAGQFNVAGAEQIVAASGELLAMVEEANGSGNHLIKKMFYERSRYRLCHVSEERAAGQSHDETRAKEDCEQTR